MRIKNKEFLLDTGEKLPLSALAGEKGLVMFFFPRANTPGCTLEVLEYAKRRTEFSNLDFNIVGVSDDNLEDQNKFACDHVIEYPLIADVDKYLINEFNLVSSKTNKNGEVVKFTKRNTYILNDELEVIQGFENVDPVKHIDEVIEVLKVQNKRLV